MMLNLGLADAVQFNANGSPNIGATCNVSLLSMEQALENALGLLLWSATLLVDAREQNTTAVSGYAQVLAARLNINMIPVSVGLAISVILFGLSCFLSRVAPEREELRGSSHKFDSMGVLQILWLSGRSPSASEHLAAQVQKPLTSYLRSAGTSLSLAPAVMMLRRVDAEEDKHLPPRGSGPVYLLNDFEGVQLNSQVQPEAHVEEEQESTLTEDVREDAHGDEDNSLLDHDVSLSSITH